MSVRLSTVRVRCRFRSGVLFILVGLLLPGGGFAQIRPLKPVGGVSVTPDGKWKSAQANSWQDFLFWVKNEYNRTLTYDLTASATGGVSSCASEVPQLILEPQQTVDVLVACYVGDSKPFGTARLTASNPYWGSDEGYYNVDIQIAAPGSPSVDVASVNPGKRLERPACVTTTAGPAGAFQCGELLVAHAMPSFRTLDRDRTLTLVYTSGTAKPHPVVMADIWLDETVEEPDSILVTLSVGTNNWSYWYSSAGLTTGGSKRRLVVGFDAEAAGLATGVHQYTLEVTNYYGGTPESPTTKSGPLIVVNRSASPYGAGWSVAGVEQLYAGVYDGKSIRLIVDGDGSAVVYDSIGANQWLAAAGAYRDTLVYGWMNPGGTAGYFYRRRFLDGTEIYYNPTGKQKWVKDRIAHSDNKVEYVYTDDGEPNSGLAWIRVAPYGQNYRYNFAYDASAKLDYITDPAGRRLEVTVGGGDLVSLLDSGFSTGKEIDLGYDSHRLTSWRSRRNHETKYTYHWDTPLLASDSLPVPGASSFEPVQIRGYATQTTGLNSTVHTASAYVLVDGPRVDAADVAKFWVNAQGAPTKIQDPLFKYTYLTYSSTHPLLATRVQWPNGRVARMDYDSRARLGWAEDSTHSSGAPSRISYLYESTYAPEAPTRLITPREGSLRDTTAYNYNTDGTLKEATDPRGYVTRFYYNARGQVDSIKDPLNHILRFGYGNNAGNLDTLVTPLGHKTKLAFDSYGNVRRVTPPAGGMTFYWHGPMNWQDSTAIWDTVYTYQLSGTYTKEYKQLVTTFTYDDDGNLIRREDPRGVQRLWEYDELGRQTQMTDEFGRSEMRSYDRAGNLTWLFPRAGGWIQTVYDAGGRDTLRIVTPSDVVTWPDTVRTSYDVVGNPTSIENVHAEITRTYTKEGAIQSETQFYKWSSSTYSYVYTYARSGARKTAEYPSDRTFTYSYGKDNLLEEIAITNPGGGSGGSVEFAYDSLGRRDTVRLPNGAETSYTYDADGRLTQARTVRNSVQLLDYQFTAFDDAGRPTAATEVGVHLSPAQPHSWTYNLRGQVLTYYGAGAEFGYAYDGSGNRVLDVNTDASANDSTVFFLVSDSAVGGVSNRVASLTTYYRGTSQVSKWREYTYDWNGNVTRTQGNDYLDYPTYYDAADRLFGHNPDSIQFRYDGLGRLVMRRAVTGLGRETSYDGSNVAVYDDQEVLHGPGVDDALVLFEPACYYVTHGGRLLVFLTESGGNCGPGGEDRWTPYAQYTGPVANSYSFGLTRAQEDQTIKLSHFRNRFYDAETGRFTQEDPIGYAGGINLYAYAGSNPATYTDPFGLWLCVEGDEVCEQLVKDLRAQSKQARDVFDIAARVFRTYKGGKVIDVAGDDPRLGRADPAVLWRGGKADIGVGGTGNIYLNADLSEGGRLICAVHESEHVRTRSVLHKPTYRHYLDLEYSAYMTLDADLRRRAIEYADRLRTFGYPTLQNNRWTLGPNIP